MSLVGFETELCFSDWFVFVLEEDLDEEGAADFDDEEDEGALRGTKIETDLEEDEEGLEEGSIAFKDISIDSDEVDGRLKEEKES